MSKNEGTQAKKTTTFKVCLQTTYLTKESPRSTAFRFICFSSKGDSLRPSIDFNELSAVQTFSSKTNRLQLNIKLTFT